MPPPHHRHWTLLGLALATCTCAWAEGADDLRFRASVGLLHDSNLFRLDPGANALALIGRSSAAETVRITSLGANYNKAYSLQRVEFDLNYTDYKYQNFNYLSFAATNYRAAWRWSYTPHLYGNLSMSRNETLNSFVDFQGFNQRNLRTDTSTRLDATYELDANWRLGGGLSRSARKNAQQLVQEGDYKLSSADAALRYVLPSGSSAAYTFTSTDGIYLNRPVPSGGLHDNGFRQTDNELQLNWAVSRDTLATVRAGHRSRTHPNYPQRDFSGLTGAANLSWSFSPKSALSAGWRRELDTFETASSNFAQVDRFTIGPVWQVSPKATLRLQLEHATRDFRGSPGVFVTQRRDTTRDASISFDWQPFNYLALSASLQNGRRSSNIAGLDYASNMVNVSAQFTY